jgi:mono/diheme cytochrome c family protein
MAGVLTVIAQPSNVVTTPPVYVADYSRANDPLPDGIIAWDATQKSVDVTNGTDFARFDFSFTNVSPNEVTILSGSGSCGCTTVQLPETPWQVRAGGAGEFTTKIDLAGKSGLISKYAIISTDKGTKNLMLRVNILPAPPAPPLSDEDRARGMAAAKVDRQAVFKGDCASCHAKNLEGKYGQELFALVCAICHEATPRATMVPDLHNLKDPTNQEFWRTWITSGKPGTLMPAFAISQGGPLSDQQIASLAAYLNAVIPPHAAPAGAK